MKKYINEEFLQIIAPILKIESFQSLKTICHHGITRYDHCFRVAYYTYKITKKLHLSYYEATVAAFLHDFFTNEVENENAFFKLRRHPEWAVKNAKEYFSLSPMQEDIIRTHMFPVTFTPPKYLESWIVDIVDDFAAIYEKVFTTKRQLSAAGTFLFLMIMNLLHF